MNNFYNFQELKEFDEHRLINFIYEPSSGLKGFVAIHRGGLHKPAFGATRLWHYKTEMDALKDALKLSRTMSYKSAMAGLGYGGAKVVLISPQLTYKKKYQILKTYSHYINYLFGHLITGADVGIDSNDLKTMASSNKMMVGLKSDAVKFTCLGVYYSMQVCLKETFGTESLVGRTFAIQGLGKTGRGILKLIYKDAKKIYVSDLYQSQIKNAKAEFPNIEVVKYTDIHKLSVDVFSPCAIANAIRFKNVSDLKCKVIVGSENNQLENEEVGNLLNKLGILYAPDYVVNGGGLITVADEYENKNYAQKRIGQRVEGIKTTLKLIIDKSKRTGTATNYVANDLAEKIFDKFV